MPAELPVLDSFFARFPLSHGFVKSLMSSLCNEIIYFLDTVEMPCSSHYTFDLVLCSGAREILILRKTTSFPSCVCLRVMRVPIN